MANIQYGNVNAKVSPSKRGQGIRNLGRGLLDITTSPLAALGINIDPNYEGENADKWNQFSQMADSVGGIAGGIGLSAVTGGLGEMLKGKIYKYGGKLKLKSGKNVYDLGGLMPDGTIPVPNAYTVVRGSKLNPETGKYLPTSDTLVGQDPGYWGENMKPVNVPPPLPLTPDGKIDFNQIKKAGIQPSPVSTFKKYKLGGEMMVNDFNKSHYKMGGNLNVHGNNSDFTEYNGNSHQLGGIPISDTDEVEGNETSANLGDGKYVFSNSILVPNSKKTFADESKKINNRYSKRPDDVWANNAKQKQLTDLMEQQELVRESMGVGEDSGNEMEFKKGGWIQAATKGMRKDKPCTGSKFGSSTCPPGSKRYNLAKTFKKMHHMNGGFTGIYDIQKHDGLSESSFIGPPKPAGLGYMEQLQSKGYSNAPLKALYSQPINEEDVLKRGSTWQYRQALDEASKPPESYSPGYGAPMLGYAAQAAANIPMLLTKPTKVKYDRVNPDLIDLTNQRVEAQSTRNKALAMARRNASMLGNAQEANSYAGTAISDIYGQYGNVYNQSLMAEKNANVGIKNQAQSQNAQIQMTEANANQQEADAVRQAKQQALFNIGQSLAAAGKSYGDMSQQGDYLAALGMSNPDYDLLFTKGNFMKKSKPYIKRRRG